MITSSLPILWTIVVLLTFACIIVKTFVDVWRDSETNTLERVILIVCLVTLLPMICVSFYCLSLLL